jgi:WD40 repeat protein
MKSAYALTFSPDDTKLYAGGWETLSVFDIAADKNKIFSERFFEGVQALSLSKDGTRVLAGSFTDVILLDCTGSLKKIETFHGLHKDTINCIAFGPDDKSFITGGKDHMTARWKIMV